MINVKADSHHGIKGHCKSSAWTSGHYGFISEYGNYDGITNRSITNHIYIINISSTTKVRLGRRLVHLVVTAEREHSLKRARVEPYTPTPAGKAKTDGTYAFQHRLLVDCSEHFSSELSESPRINRPQTESKMDDAIKPFLKYIQYLATGKLDAYMDSLQRRDKETDLNMNLPIHPSLLLHDLGKYLDQEQIKRLFVSDSMFVVFVML